MLFFEQTTDWATDTSHILPPRLYMYSTFKQPVVRIPKVGRPTMCTAPHRTVPVANLTTVAAAAAAVSAAATPPLPLSPPSTPRAHAEGL